MINQEVMPSLTSLDAGLSGQSVPADLPAVTRTYLPLLAYIREHYTLSNTSYGQPCVTMKLREPTCV